MNLTKYFYKLRHNPIFHLGLGDIRLTVAMQDEVVSFQEKLCEDFLSRLKTANISLQEKTSKNNYLVDLLWLVLDYHNGTGQFDVSHMSDEGQVLGEMLEGLLEEIKEALVVG